MIHNKTINEWNYDTTISYIDSDHEQEITNDEEAETLLNQPASQTSRVDVPTIINAGSTSSRNSVQSIFGNMNKSIVPQNLSPPVASKLYTSILPGSKFHIWKF